MYVIHNSLMNYVVASYIHKNIEIKKNQHIFADHLQYL